MKRALDMTLGNGWEGQLRDKSHTGMNRENPTGIHYR